ncbi:hypothetical protein ST45_10415 [Prevotella pectinovora]|uniref:hypothetical protein n=1 Tax=Prevotella pectinovora TaxID=1602169 RepID=UPI0005B6E5AF|nr:hypothetical protein [Prevotella pectinovora]KIP60694.1 hypothetical protein ST45_10415 [Prevotella pectinovora]
MKRLSKKQIGRAACTILQQLALTTPLNVVYSWRITNKVATQIEIMVDGMEKNVAALMMDVNGFNYQGRLYVTNNRVKQTFGLYSERNGMLHEENENIAFKDLGQVLDAVIETGGMSQQKHLQRLREYAKRLLA